MTDNIDKKIEELDAEVEDNLDIGKRKTPFDRIHSQAESMSSSIYSAEHDLKNAKRSYYNILKIVREVQKSEVQN